MRARFQYTCPLGVKVHEQMYRSDGQSEVRPQKLKICPNTLLRLEDEMELFILLKLTVKIYDIGIEANRAWR
ncbi:hypothetical protein TNCV_3016571 [Trichonephila clavipes]|nr:hypothetical protein TNCV_3016571 [Trichonephila clavipes]